MQQIFKSVADEWKANVPQGFELSLEADASDWEWVGGVLNAAYELGGVEATQKLMEETGMTTVVEADQAWGDNFGWNQSLGPVGKVRKDVAIAMQALSDGEQDMADKVLAAMDPQWVLEKAQWLTTSGPSGGMIACKALSRTHSNMPASQCQYYTYVATAAIKQGQGDLLNAYMRLANATEITVGTAIIITAMDPARAFPLDQHLLIIELAMGCKMELDLPARSYEPGSGHAEEHSLTMGYMLLANVMASDSSFVGLTLAPKVDLSVVILAEDNTDEATAGCLLAQRAVQAGFTDLALLILKNPKFDVAARYANNIHHFECSAGAAVLMTAATLGDNEVAQKCLDLGTQIDEAMQRSDVKGTISMIEHACNTEDRSAMEWLVDHGAELDATQASKSSTHQAAQTRARLMAQQDELKIRLQKHERTHKQLHAKKEINHRIIASAMDELDYVHKLRKENHVLNQGRACDPSACLVQ